MTDRVVGSSAWFGSVFIRELEIYAAEGLVVWVVWNRFEAISQVRNGSESSDIRRLRPVASTLAVCIWFGISDFHFALSSMWSRYPHSCPKSSDVPNVQDEPRPQLARSVLLGARSVTAVVVGSSDWFGSVVFISVGKR